MALSYSKVPATTTEQSRRVWKGDIPTVLRSHNVVTFTTHLEWTSHVKYVREHGIPSFHRWTRDGYPMVVFPYTDTQVVDVIVCEDATMRLNDSQLSALYPANS